MPEGYEQDAQEEELAQYLRDYSVYKKTKIKYYTGRTKSVSGEAVAVLKLPMEEVNLQQQTASVQRMYGEYFWSKGEYDRIKSCPEHRYNLQKKDRRPVPMRIL